VADIITHKIKTKVVDKWN